MALDGAHMTHDDLDMCEPNSGSFVKDPFRLLVQKAPPGKYSSKSPKPKWPNSCAMVIESEFPPLTNKGCRGVARELDNRAEETRNQEASGIRRGWPHDCVGMPMILRVIPKRTIVDYVNLLKVDLSVGGVIYVFPSLSKPLANIYKFDVRSIPINGRSR